MSKVVVVGASGFIGGHLARALVAEGKEVRCVARTPSKVDDSAVAGSEVVPGDISDPGSLRRALESARAVYVSVHTLGPQHAGTAGRGFMQVEADGLRNVVEACRACGVRRLVHVTGLGVAPDSPSEWARGRWEVEQSLLGSGLDVTVIRPGQVVGKGGLGFGITTSLARRRVALMLGSGRNKMQNIAVDDLTYYLVGVLDDPRAHGRCYDVGGDEVLTSRQMIDAVAEVLGRPHPFKVQFPRRLLGVVAPLIERLARSPKGSIKAMVDVLEMDLTGDPRPIRALLPRAPLSYREAAAKALLQEKP